MHPLSLETHCNITSMLENGYSVWKIASRLGVGKSTIGEICSQLTLPLKENLGGHPSILSSQDKQHLVCLVTTGGADTATQTGTFHHYQHSNHHSIHSKP